MCLIVFTPHVQRATIRRSILERGFNRNRDGAGFAYVRDGRVIVSKMHETFDAFWLAYQRFRSSGARGPLIIHFRWKTCGPINVVNTQPISIYSGRLAMAHNGIFAHLSEPDSGISDSVQLARIIKRVGWDFPFKKGEVEMLDALCGVSSKLVFIDHRGHHLIVNEKAGAWKDGCWYSDGGSVCRGDGRYAKSTHPRDRRNAHRDGYDEYAGYETLGPAHPDARAIQAEDDRPPIERAYVPKCERANRVKQIGAIVVARRIDGPIGSKAPKDPSYKEARLHDMNLPLPGTPRCAMNASEMIAYDRYLRQLRDTGMLDPDDALSGQSIKRSINGLGAIIDRGVIGTNDHKPGDFTRLSMVRSHESDDDAFGVLSARQMH